MSCHINRGRRVVASARSRIARALRNTIGLGGSSMQYGSVPGVTKPVSRLVQGTVMVGSAEPEMYLALLDFYSSKAARPSIRPMGIAAARRARHGALVLILGAFATKLLSSQGAHTTVPTGDVLPRTTSPRTSSIRWPGSSSTTWTCICCIATTRVCPWAPSSKRSTTICARAVSMPSADRIGARPVSAKPMSMRPCTD